MTTKIRVKTFGVLCAAAALTLAAAATFAGSTSLKWVGCGISKKAFMGAVSKAYERKTGITIALEGGGATRGIVDVAAGKADMGGSCRHVLMRDAERGVKLVAVGWDALAVITHRSNPVSSLTIKQIRDIFSGAVTNWKQVGGPSQRINVMVREGKISGVGRMVRELLFRKPDYEFTADATRFKATGPLEAAVEKEPWTIGFTGISSARKRQVKLLAIEGKEPSYDTIANGQYMLYRPLYLTVPHRASPEVRSFVSFVLSEEGQSIIKNEGTVTLKDGSNLWPIYNTSMKEAGIKAGTF